MSVLPLISCPAGGQPVGESDRPGEIRLRGPHLVVLMGAAAAGKSTWAQRHFLPTQIVSTDRCRALVGDREHVQAYSKQAFELFYFLIEKRMELNKLVVADSTALDPAVRRKLLDLARAHSYPAALVVFSAGLEVRRVRNLQRDRKVSDEVLVRQQILLETAMEQIRREGWEAKYVLDPDAAETAEVTRLSPGVYSSAPPPYDIVGDVHGCYTELTDLLGTLGWRASGETYAHPEGRTLISVGDLADRGPDVPSCYRLLIRLAAEGKALFVPGNHDNKLLRYLLGRRVKISHGIERSIAQLDALPEGERDRLKQEIVDLIEGAPPYLILDRGKVVVAHAGLKKEMIGKVSREITSFTLYGDVTGRQTPEGLPERRDWAAEYRGRSLIVYGHTPVRKPVLRHKTVNIDQGCVFGGALTALRYPEMELVSVRAREVYADRQGGLIDADDRA